METLRRILRFGLQNYLRNGWLSLATTFVLAMTLFIVAVFSLQTYVIKETTKSIEDKLDMSIYLSDEPTEEVVLAFVQEVKAYPEVKQVDYLNKQRVITEWQKLQVADAIKSHVNEQNNPLPRTLKVQANDPTLLDSIADKVNASTLSAQLHMSYRDNRPVIQHLVAQSKKTTKNGIIVSSIFIFIAIVFVYNTIRIIIRFRQDEIAIMKLVGATDSFVRGPFMVEGALYGIFAGLITLVAMFFYLQNGLSESTSVVTSPDSLVAERLFQFFSDNMILLGSGLIGVAVVIAILCSSISVHYHLKR